MTLFISFAPSYQYILAWATLHYPMLHHCISSVLCCKPNNHCAQGPKNDYTHAYSHPLSNLSSLQSPFWSLSVFWLLIFLTFTCHPSASIELAVYYMNFHLNRPLWPKHSTGRTMHSTYFKIRPSIYLFKAYIALESSASILVFGWSVVSYHHSNTQQLCAPVFHSYGTSPWTSLMRNPTPLAHSLLYLAT